MTSIETSMNNALVGTIDHAGEHAEARYNFPVDFKGFDGHFPGHPILPAVLQIMLGKLVCNVVAGELLRVTSISRAKFSQEIPPATDIHVAVDRKELSAENTHRFSVKLSVDTMTAATFTLFCETERTNA